MSGVWAAAIVAFALVLVLTPVARWLGRRMYPLDVPNARSSHVIPTPRTGGLSIAAGIAVACLVMRTTGGGVGAILVGAAVICALAFADDTKGLHVGMRFLVQVLAATGVVVVAGLRLLPPEVMPSALATVAVAVVTVLWIVWFTNAFNFMDGINGIAGIEALVCAATFAVLFARVGDWPAATVSAAIGAAAAGFLPYNFPRATIFMGDVGSAPLGFLLAALAARLGQRGHLLAALLPLLPFVLDATFTLLARAARRERIWEAHRSHWYQRFALHVGHGRSTTLYGVLALAGGCAAIILQWLPPAARILVICLVVFANLLAGRLIDVYCGREDHVRSSRLA